MSSFYASLIQLLKPFSTPFSQLGLYSLGLFACLSSLIFIFSHHFLSKSSGKRQKTSFIRLAFLIALSNFLTCVGLALVVGTVQFASILSGIALAVCGVCVGALSADPKKKSLEGLYKFLVSAGFGFGLIALSFSMINSFLGISSVVDFADFLSAPAAANNSAVSMFLLFLLTGVAGFLGLFPWHSWQVDFFESIPTPLVSVLDNSIKLSFVFLLVRLSANGYGDYSSTAQPIFVFFGVLSVLGAGLLSLSENNLKKILSHVSTFHFGMIFLAFPSFDGASDLPIHAVCVFVLSYAFLSTLAFLVVAHLENQEPGNQQMENIGMQDLVGLGSIYPAESALLAFSALALAGFPLALGYFARGLVLDGLLGGGHWQLAVAACVGGLFILYPLAKVVAALFLQSSSTFQSTVRMAPRRSACFVVFAACFSIAVVFFSTFGRHCLEDLVERHTVGLIKK